MRLTQLRKQVAAELAGEAVPMLSIKGNTFTLQYDGNNKVVSKIDGEGRLFVDVIFADAATNKSRMYWANRYSSKEDDQVAPDCFSEDGVKPDSQSGKPQCDFCAQCPHNVWGTAIGEQGASKGKRCREVWKTAVIVPSFSPEALFQLRVPPASLKHFNAYMAQFAEIEVEGREADPGDVVTRVYFEHDKQGIINFEGAAYVTPEQREYVLLVNECNMASNLIGMNNSAPALPAPEAKKQLAAPSKPGALAAITKQSTEEEDDEAVLAQAMAEAKQRLAESKSKVVQTTKAPASQETKPLPRAAAKPVEQPKARGMIALQPGMRTKTDTPASGAGVSRYNAAIARVEAQEAEIVPEADVVNAGQQSMAIMKKARPVETPAGIPSTNLPDDLQNLLNGIMES